MIRTVMVVEDDDAIRMVLRTNLEDEGYRVLEAVTAEQGLVIVQANYVEQHRRMRPKQP